MSLVVFARLVFPELSLPGRGARRSAGHGRRKGHFSVGSFSLGCSGLRLFSHHCVSSFLALVPVSSALAVGGSLVVIGDLDLAEHTIGRNGDFIEATFKAQRFLESNLENVGGGVLLSVGQGALLSKLFEFSSKVVNVVHLGQRILRVLCLILVSVAPPIDLRREAAKRSANPAGLFLILTVDNSIWRDAGSFSWRSPQFSARKASVASRCSFCVKCWVASVNEVSVRPQM